MSLGSVVRITCFDDGNDRFVHHPNTWRVNSTWKGKLELVNTKNGTVISSISAWKTMPLN